MASVILGRGVGLFLGDLHFSLGARRVREIFFLGLFYYSVLFLFLCFGFGKDLRLFLDYYLVLRDFTHVNWCLINQFSVVFQSTVFIIIDG